MYNYDFIQELIIGLKKKSNNLFVLSQEIATEMWFRLESVLV